MKKAIYSFFLVFLFLISCSTHQSPYWRFTTDKDIQVYYSSEWKCFYKPADDKIWVECYKKENNDTSFFYANSVEYSEDK